MVAGNLLRRERGKPSRGAGEAGRRKAHKGALTWGSSPASQLWRGHGAGQGRAGAQCGGEGDLRASLSMLLSSGWGFPGVFVKSPHLWAPPTLLLGKGLRSRSREMRALEAESCWHTWNHPLGPPSSSQVDRGARHREGRLPAPLDMNPQTQSGDLRPSS